MYTWVECPNTCIAGIACCEWTGISQNILTLSMLNCQWLWKMHSHFVSYLQQKKAKFTMEQPYMLPILYCQYHVSWCPGDLRSQGISGHGYWPNKPGYSIFSIRTVYIEELCKLYIDQWCQCSVIMKLWFAYNYLERFTGHTGLALACYMSCPCWSRCSVLGSDGLHYHHWAQVISMQ